MTKLLPAFNAILDWSLRLLNWSAANWPRFQQIIRDAVEKVRPYFERLVAYWNDTLLPTIRSIVEIARKFWAQFGSDIKRNLKAAATIVKTVMQQIKAIIELAMAILRGDWSAAWQALKTSPATRSNCF